MTSDERTTAAKELRETVDTLRRATALFNRSDTVKLFAEQLNDAVQAGDVGKAEIAARGLSARLELVMRLVKIADELDPHAVDGDELDRLWGLAPNALVNEALRRGELRERRLVLQAKEAETNQLLAVAAFAASILAVLLFVLERLFDAL